jgi:N-formylglutamate amidohydrolase
MTGDDTNAPPPFGFEQLGPLAPASPLVLSVPHAGRFYPPAVMTDCAVSLATLEELEDRHADLLVTHAVADGAVAIVARVARAWIDLNRGEEDRDPAPDSGIPASARSRSGLGLIPRRIGRRDLWCAALSPASVDARIATVHRPYHEAITQALAQAWRHYGYAVLIDCHSMPPLCGARAPSVVIGDRHGRTAGPGVAALLAQHAREAGFRAAINAPYAGAHGITRHGDPARGIHAIQVEIDRTLYLRSDMRSVSHGLEEVQALLASLGRRAVAATQPALSIAAE